MGIPLRTYQHFEAGHGRIDIDRLQRFAQALNADLYAILIALEIGSPAFALRCVDNKLATILMMSLQDFDASMGDEISQLDPHTLMKTFTRLFDELRDAARSREALLESWMSGRALGAAPDDDAE